MRDRKRVKYNYILEHFDFDLYQKYLNGSIKQYEY